MDSQENEIIQEMAKEVYARFGAAYYFSECVHKGLCILYALLTSRDKSDTTRPHLEEKLKLAYSLTLGQIVKKARQYLPNSLQTDLDQALERRNYLAHDFWFEHIHLMTSIEGLRNFNPNYSTSPTFFANLIRTSRTFFNLSSGLTGLTTIFFSFLSIKSWRANLRTRYQANVTPRNKRGLYEREISNEKLEG